MKRVEGFPRMTEERKKELQKLAALEDTEINTSDIPEWTAEDFARSVPLRSLYKPRKHQITTNVDADVLLWLKSRGGRYQSRLNEILREAMLRDRKKRNMHAKAKKARSRQG